MKVKKNTSIELAVALMLKGMAYMLCILVCAMFLPLLSALSDDVVKLTLKAVSSPLFIVFTVIGGLYPFVLMSALEEQTKQERAQNQ
jgi:ABC-type Fe3+-siderophore transport system permease subunit